MDQLEYLKALEKFLDIMNDIRNTVSPEIGKAIKDLCEVLGVGKLSVTFYESQRHRVLGKGNVVTFYETITNDDEPSIKMEKETEGFNIAIYSAKHASNSDVFWNEGTADRVLLMLKMLYIFNGRSRLLDIASRFTYYDDDGYTNLKYYLRQVTALIRDRKLSTRAAAQLNLKHFTLINQQVGRDKGTFAMRMYIEALRNAAGSEGIVCRMGGDNFIMLFNKERLAEVIEVLNGVPVSYDVNTEDKVNIRATAGVVVMPDDYEYKNPSDLMDKLITTSQIARSNGNDDIIFFNHEIVENRERIIELQKIFPDALRNEEFLVYYQPKIDIVTGQLAGAEALCRWMHNGSLVSPADFIPMLEQSMDICRLDFYMLDHVCKDIRRWLDEGRRVERVSVNLSRKHLVDVDLQQHIIEIVDRNNIPHKYIEVELTETTTDVDFTDLKRVVRGLQDVGIYTSVDDFGIGYSSLNLIKEIPWNVLKVDRSFLPEDNENDNSRRSVLFKYVVAMAREMGLECIVEGVETEAQVNLLKDNRCDLAQGFFFDRPLPVKDYEERLDRHSYK